VPADAFEAALAGLLRSPPPPAGKPAPPPPPPAAAAAAALRAVLLPASSETLVCGACGTQSLLPPPTRPGHLARRLQATSLAFVRSEALLGPRCSLGEALRELSSQQLGACGAGASCRAPCPRRSTLLRAPPPLFAIAVDWEGGGGAAPAAPEVASALDGLQGPLDVASAYDASPADAPAVMHALRVLLVLEGPSGGGKARSAAAYARAGEGWAELGAGGPQPLLTWAQLKAKCASGRAPPVLAFYAAP